MASNPHPADGGELEDEPQPPGGGGPGAEAGLDADDKKHDYAKVEVVVRAAVHRPPLGADAGRRRPALDPLRRPGRLRRTTSGAYTGEISAGDARQARLQLRRASGTPSGASTTPSPTSWSTPRRTRRSAAGMTPIVCVGEGLEVRQAGEHVPYTLAQLDGSLAGFTAEQVAGLVVAYEPVWAIGTGEVATPDDAQEVCAAIRGAGPRGARRRRGRRRTRPLRRLGEGGQRRRDHGARPTSTAAWSAAPACRSTSSAGSAASTTCRSSDRRRRDVGFPP